MDVVSPSFLNMRRCHIRRAVGLIDLNQQTGLDSYKTVRWMISHFHDNDGRKPKRSESTRMDESGLCRGMRSSNPCLVNIEFTKCTYAQNTFAELK
jgi:hypothetical protein